MAAGILSEEQEDVALSMMWRMLHYRYILLHYSPPLRDDKMYSY